MVGNLILRRRGDRQDSLALAFVRSCVGDGIFDPVVINWCDDVLCLFVAIVVLREAGNDVEGGFCEYVAVSLWQRNLPVFILYTR